MRYLISIVLFLACTVCFAQSEVKSDTIKLTKLQEEKLVQLENQINELKQKQIELIQLIVDANGFDVNAVTDFKYENGKFIFKTKLK